MIDSVFCQNLDGRIKLLLYRLRSQIPEVSEDIEGDIAIANRDRVILATANFLGSKSINF